MTVLNSSLNKIIYSTSLVSVPEVSISELSVHSIPFKLSDPNLQSTFSSVASSPSSSIKTFNISTSITNKYGTDLDPSSDKLYTPALRSILKSKKSSLYKGRKSNNSSKELLSLSSPLSSLLSLPSSSSCSITNNSHLECSISNSSYYSIPSLDYDINTLCSNNQSHSLIKFYEIDENDHPLSTINNKNSNTEVSLQDFNQNTENKIEKEDAEITEQNELIPETSFFFNFKKKIKSSSIILNAKSFYKNNEAFFTTSINLIEIPNKDIILNDSVPLETFHTSYKPIDAQFSLDANNLFTISKTRECRVNSNFLKFFAIDSSIKLHYSDHLLNESTIDFYQNEFINSGLSSIDEFLNYSLINYSINKYNDNSNYDNDINDNENLKLQKLKQLIKFALLSRDKMWSSVVLSPRNDMFQHCKNSNILRNCYIQTETQYIPNGSLIRENGKVMPWLKLNDCNRNNKRCFNPSGILPNNIQYTVKTWENKRWSSITT